MIHYWKGVDFEIRDFEYHYDPTSSGDIIPSQTSNIKHVEIIKVSDKPTYDTLLERLWLGDHRCELSPWSDTFRWNYNISNLKRLNM